MTKRIAITVSDSSNGELQVADHFGRCSQFFVYEIDENLKVIKEESYQNPLAGHNGGACELPGYIRDLGAHVIIAGGMGRKAIDNFNSFNIEVVTAPGAAVVDAVTDYLNGQLKGYDPCAGHEGGC
ncbi:MAG: dinitrogenase iron-molybdenum cofactor biosynthesis protein [Calditrichaeota bacterium]|nr:NifB/NifX family molybdenum-iron cluster-binding protein [Calditrichota bacterium]RQW04929.1 MAG: dinitrogenase iron-molybdenum cofactor biosynthesis protein [Calditrichota bacterium]